MREELYLSVTCGLLNGSDYVTSNGSTIVSYEFESVCEEEVSALHLVS